MILNLSTIDGGQHSVSLRPQILKTLSLENWGKGTQNTLNRKVGREQGRFGSCGEKYILSLWGIEHRTVQPEAYSRSHNLCYKNYVRQYPSYCTSFTSVLREFICFKWGKYYANEKKNNFLNLTRIEILGAVPFFLNNTTQICTSNS